MFDTWLFTFTTPITPPTPHPDPHPQPHPRPTARARNRQTRKNALEDELGELPFDTFQIMAGTEGKEVRVATMKAVVRVGMKGEPLPPEDQALLEAMMKPKARAARTLTRPVMSPWMSPWMKP